MLNLAHALAIGLAPVIRSGASTAAIDEGGRIHPSGGRVARSPH